MAVSQTVRFEDSNSADSDEFGIKSILLKGLSSGDELEIVEAVSSPPRITRGMDEAATLEVEVTNHDRAFSSKKIPKHYAVVRGLRFAYTAWDKSGNYVTLTYEDAVVNKLKGYTQARKWDAGKLQLKQILQDVADSAQVQIVYDRDLTAIVANVTEMKDGDNAWDLLKSLASERNLRCFSDGWQVFFGWDGWLAGITPPVPLSEPKPGEPQSDNPVYSIDVTCDAGMDANTAKVSVDSELWALPPGRCVEISGEGWGDGVWLVSHFERTLTSPVGTVDLVRRRAPLPEPESTEKGAETGEDGFDTSDASVVNIDADLARLRQCEATGNYKANTGNGYYGAYQFDLKTWQGLGYSGRPDQATPAKQDEAATKLYQQRGWSPWPSCSKKLGLVDKRNSGGGSKATGGNANLVNIAVAMAKSNPRYFYGGKKTNGPWDCSGFVAEATKRAGKQLAGGSKEQKATCQKQGKLVPVAVGLKTPGAILFRMKVINGNTHVAISMGDGRTVEARGSADGVGVFGNASGRGFDFAAIWI